MTEKKGSSTPEESAKSDTPKITAKDIKPIEQAILKELGVYCKSDGELVLAREVALNRAIIMQLQEAVAVRDSNYEKLRAINAVQIHAMSKRLEDLESK
jgi:hypothetical protein